MIRPATLIPTPVHRMAKSRGSREMKNTSHCSLSPASRLCGLIVLFAYVLPLMLVLSTLAVTWIFTADETAAAIYSLTILIPYYLVLALFRKSFARRFSFEIRD